MNDGELKAYKLLSDNNWVVQDLTRCEQYYDKDIDLSITDGHRSYTIEVKWDNVISRTGNMFIETFTDLDKSKQGWFLFCEADYIFYGDSKNNLFHIFRTQNLRDYISNHTTPERKAPDYNKRGKLKKISQGYIVPIDDFRQYHDVITVRL